MKKFIIPSVLISETHFHHIYTKEAIADAVEHVLLLNRYGALELPFVPFAKDRKRIFKALKSKNVRSIQWVGGILESEGYNLSSLDKQKRRKSLSRFLELMELAGECGIDVIGILSGPNPGREHRDIAIKVLAENLNQAITVAESIGLKILLEPLDLTAHKKGLIGTMREISQLEEMLGENFKKIKISLDISHVLLNNENPVFFLTKRHLEYIHFANPVLKRDHPLFGDRHIPPGPPGVLGLKEAATLFKTIRNSYLPDKRPVVSMEIRSKPRENPWNTERTGWNFLVNAWKQSKNANL